MSSVAPVTRPVELTLAEMVDQLTDRHKSAAAYSFRTRDTTYATVHVTEHPALLDQLEAAVQLLGNADDGVRLGFGSKPSARIDAIDVILRIEHESGEWARRPSIAESVRAAASLVPSLSACRKWNPRERCCRRHLLEHQVRQWWTWARLTTGWDRPAWRPDATCPACGKRGGLRLRLDEEQRTGMCVECHETWDEETIGRLALHVKAEAQCAVDGCDERARFTRPTESDPTRRVCSEHAIDLTSLPRRLTLRGLGEVSPHEVRITAGLVDLTACRNGHHDRELVLAPAQDPRLGASGVRVVEGPCRRCGE